MSKHMGRVSEYSIKIFFLYDKREIDMKRMTMPERMQKYMKKEPKKIIVFGFCHSGTSILKSIIGHIKTVEEIVEETDEIKSYSGKKQYVLCKFPYVVDKFFTNAYNDYIKIFIVRNPVFVFSSLNKRFHNAFPPSVSIAEYKKMISKFVHYKKNPVKNLYLLRYEDMFHRNYQELRNILDAVGLCYTDDIFNNTKYSNHILNGLEPPDNQPPNDQHALFRTWQINQPFVSNNDPSKIALSHEQAQELLHDSVVRSVYKEIPSLLAQK